MNHRRENTKGKLDWMIMIVPTITVAGLSVLFFFLPDQSNNILGRIRFILGDTFGVYYIIIGFGIFLLSIYIACSRYGNIVLGSPGEKPQYSLFSWGCMMFTCGLAADILFYSCAEWVLYAVDPYVAESGSVQELASVYPLFHWRFIPWGFYLVLAVAFGFMLHVKKRTKQKYSEACRPLLGRYTDGICGRLIDLLAVFALIAGTATTFSVATPLMAAVLSNYSIINLSRSEITIIILLLTCLVYTFSLLHGFKGISILAKTCIFMFFGLLLIVFMTGGQSRYIVENGVQSFGIMINRFFELSSFTDPLRKSNFPQNWTIYYWSYWMVWCVAAPFFIGNISKGRTVRQVIFGGYIFGAGSTVLSFVVLGNYGMGLQMSGAADFAAAYSQTGDIYAVVIEILETLPGAPFIFLLLLVTMIAFYATSFDSIALTVSLYSYYKLKKDESPHKCVQLVWCILLIIFPVALVFSESSMNNLQSVSIAAAFPIAFIIVLIAASFLKDAAEFLNMK